MTKSQLITLLVAALCIPACASSPTPSAYAQGRPASIDCRSVAPTGSKLKTKTVCGAQGHGQSVLARKANNRNFDPRDPLGNRRTDDR
jgi:hypothetical protein